jgi:hypothetical protein
VFDVEVTDEFQAWFNALADADADTVAARVELLAEQGPNLKRPVVGEIVSSRFAPRMKELRCGTAGAIRVLFAFDPGRTAILLPGGSNAGHWEAWYEQAVPEADRLYEVYLEELRKEGLL